MENNLVKKSVQENRFGQKTVDTSGFPELAHNVLKEYFQAKSCEYWVFGSTVLIAIFLIVLHFSKENVYFPFFEMNEQKKELLLLLSSNTNSTPSAILNSYAYLGKIKFTFNDFLKLLLLLFLGLMLLKTAFNSIIVPLWLLLKIVFPKIFMPIQNVIDKLPRRYTFSSWLASSYPLNVKNVKGELIHPQLRRRIPYRIRKFEFIKFDISVLEHRDHWRAGVFIISQNKNRDYAFHIYKNEGDPQLRTKMTRRNFQTGAHENENDTNLFDKNVRNFHFEVRTEELNIYSLRVNGQEVDRHNVPKEDFEFIEIGAWADDKPYKIKFTNIEFYG